MDNQVNKRAIQLVEYNYNVPKYDNPQVLTKEQKKTIDTCAQAYEQIRLQLKKRIVGLDDIIEKLLISIFSGNHSLLVGVPGLAKTLLIKSLAELLNLKFSRIQFTPDLMPSDITGTEVLVQDEYSKKREYNFLKGSVFANIILADEINRTPPKTQSALLEAMEEHTVTTTGKTFELDPPFFVLATQNPIEQEGTYPLPVAQLDRFMFNLLLDYPEKKDEHKIMRLTISSDMEKLEPLLSKEQILKLLEIVYKVPVSKKIMNYIVNLIRYSRPQNSESPDFIKENLSWGASPRATQFLIIGAKALAVLKGRYEIRASDVREIMYPVMRHRIILNCQAEANGTSPDEIIDKLILTIPSPDDFSKKRNYRKYSQKLYISVSNR